MGGKQKAAQAVQAREIVVKERGNKRERERIRPRLSWNLPIRRVGLHKQGHSHRSRKGGRNKWVSTANYSHF